MHFKLLEARALERNDELFLEGKGGLREREREGDRDRAQAKDSESKGAWRMI